MTRPSEEDLRQAPVGIEVSTSSENMTFYMHKEVARRSDFLSALFSGSWAPPPETMDIPVYKVQLPPTVPLTGFKDVALCMYKGYPPFNAHSEARRRAFASAADFCLLSANLNIPRIFFEDEAPQAHSAIPVKFENHLGWSLMSSRGDSGVLASQLFKFAAKRLYVAARLSSTPMVGFQLVVELQGRWNKGDKLLLGALPLESPVDNQVYVLKPEASAVGSTTSVPVGGFWFSVTSFRFLVHGGRNLLRGGLHLSPHSKKQGSRWGLRVARDSTIAVGLQEDARGVMQWQEVEIDEAFDVAACLMHASPALLMQPHTRQDDTQASVRVVDVEELF
jgi:hypothetical protein